MKVRVVFLCVILLFLTAAPAWGFLFRTILPEEASLTVYQGVDKAWIEGVFTIPCEQGENGIFLPQNVSLEKRLFLRPLDPQVQVRTIENDVQGTKVNLFTLQAGNYRLLLGFFASGFDWRCMYTARLVKGELSFAPAVFIENRSTEDFETVRLRWLLGSPSFVEEEVPEGVPDTQKVSGVAAPREAEAPITMERVTEYQVFTLQGKRSLTSQSILQVFPEIRRFLTEELVRFQGDTLSRVLILKNPGEPLPPGYLFLENEGMLTRAFFPGIREGEKLELPLPFPPGVSVKRTITDYRREEAYFNKEKEVVGFRSLIEITFECTNETEQEVTLEILESLPTLETLELPPHWEWKDHNALRRITLLPREKKTLVLTYQFEEANL